MFREEDRKKDEGMEEEITVDQVIRARGNMLPDTANGLVDIIVTEMLKELTIETINVVTKCFQRSFVESATLQLHGKL